MINNKAIEKELAFIKTIEGKQNATSIYFAHFSIFFSCFIVHVMYLYLFAVNNIIEMAVFNIFSVTFYIGMILAIPRVHNKEILVYLTVLEIIVHATCATIFVGLDSNFAMFLLMIIPILLLMPYKTNIVASILVLTSIGIYGFLGLYCSVLDNIVYPNLPEKISDTFYVINIFVGAFVLIFVAGLYGVINQYTRYKLKVQNEQLRQIALFDPLTQIYNRRAMGDHLNYVSSTSKKTGKDYVIGLGDIDDFKKINDKYGHATGDVVLTTVARIIENEVPNTGYVARWGGEEFLFVIPDIDAKSTRDIADKILTTISSNTFKKDDITFNVTMTLGISEASPSDDYEKIISKADSLMYRGKYNGKNRAEYAEEI